MSQSKECQICSEVKNQFKCDSCEKECCYKCFNKYIMQHFDPSCMFCKTNFSDDLIYQISTKKFYNEWKDNRFLMIFSREKSLLPDTQQAVEEKNFNQLLHDLREEKENIDKQLKDMNPKKPLNSFTIFVKEKYQVAKQLSKNHTFMQLGRIWNGFSRDEKLVYTEKEREAKLKYKEELNLLYSNEEYEKKFCELQARLMFIKRKYRHLSRGRYDYDKPVVKYSLACPEDCRGFLSSAYKCGTCKKNFCPDCLEFLEEDHKCNEATKATVALLKSDTKPCPKCSIRIHRTEGCSLMWCVICHTSFNWNTGAIETGYNHNPEYFRYLRENGLDIARNPLDNPCGDNQLPAQWRIPNFMHIENIYLYIHHIRGVKDGFMHDYTIDTFKDLRISYMMGEIDEEDWEITLKKSVKKFDKEHELYQVYDMVYQVMIIGFQNYMEHKDPERLKRESDTLLKYSNKQLSHINKKHGSSNTRYLFSEEYKRK